MIGNMGNLVAMIPLVLGPLQILCALLPVIFMALGSLLLALCKPEVFRKALHLAWRVKLTLVILGGGIACAILLPGKLSFSRTGDDPFAKDAVFIDWSMARGGPQRLGSLPASESPADGAVIWTFKKAKTIYSSPALADGRVYVTSAEKTPFKDRGYVYCVDALTGELRWQSSPERMRATFSSPVVSGKYLVCGEGLHDTERGRVICLDIERQGAIVWQFETRSHVESTPCIYDQRVFVGAGDDGYYCLDLRPLTNGQPRVIWHAQGNRYLDAESSPIVVGGKMYAGLGESGNALVCLDSRTGAALWRITTPYPVFSAPSLVKGKLYVGMGNGNYIQTAAEVMRQKLAAHRRAGKTDSELARLETELAAGGELWCIDTAAADQKTSGTSGEHLIPATDVTVVRWRFKLSDTVLGAVAVDGDEVYAAARDGNVYCLSTNGQERSRWTATQPILASPAVTKEYVVVLTESGTLFVLRRPDLELVWRETFSGGGSFLSSPAVGLDHIYVGTPKEGLLCLGGSADNLPPVPMVSNLAFGGRLIGTPVRYHHIGVVALEEPSRLVAFDCPTGSILWQNDCQATTPPRIEQATIYVGTRDGVSAWRLQDGKRIVAAP